MSKDVTTHMSDQRLEYYLLNAKICTLVQKHPCVYDRLSPNYMHKEFIDPAWETISREVGDTVGACKKRWKHIRKAYAQSLRPNSGGSTPHEPYYLHKHLTFLNAHILQSYSNESDENHQNSPQSIDIPYDSCTYQINLVSASPTVSDEEEAQESEHVITPEPDIKTEPEPEQNLEIEPENIPKQKPNYSEQPTHSKKRSRENISEDFPSPKRTKIRDFDSEFLDSLLPEIKSMNSRQKILFKGKIFKVLEEVFSDSRVFPQNDQPLTVAGSESDQTTLPTGMNLASRFNGNGVTIERQKSSKTGGGGGITIAQFARSSFENNITIRQEDESLEIKDKAS